MRVSQDEGYRPKNKDCNILGSIFGFPYFGQLPCWAPTSRSRNVLIVSSRSVVSRVCYSFTWTPKVCKIMAPRAILKGLGLLFYILLGFRYTCLLMSVGDSVLISSRLDSCPTTHVGFSGPLIRVI